MITYIKNAYALLKHKLYIRRYNIGYAFATDHLVLGTATLSELRAVAYFDFDGFHYDIQSQGIVDACNDWEIGSI